MVDKKRMWRPEPDSPNRGESNPLAGLTPSIALTQFCGTPRRMSNLVGADFMTAETDSQSAVMSGHTPDRRNREQALAIRVAALRAAADRKEADAGRLSAKIGRAHV